MASFVVITKSLNNCDSKFYGLTDWQKCHLGYKTFLIWDRRSVTAGYADPAERRRYHLAARCASASGSTNYFFSYSSFFLILFFIRFLYDYFEKI